MQGAFVSIGGNLLNDAIPGRVEVVQRLNDPWTCEIECRDTLGQRVPGEEALGAACTLTNIAEDGTAHVAFGGLVIDVALKQEVWAAALLHVLHARVLQRSCGLGVEGRGCVRGTKAVRVAFSPSARCEP